MYGLNVFFIFNNLSIIQPNWLYHSFLLLKSTFSFILIRLAFFRKVLANREKIHMLFQLFRYFLVTYYINSYLDLCKFRLLFHFYLGLGKCLVQLQTNQSNKITIVLMMEYVLKNCFQILCFEKHNLGKQPNSHIFFVQ